MTRVSQKNTYTFTLNENEWIDGPSGRYWIKTNGEWLEVESEGGLKSPHTKKPLPEGHPALQNLK